MKLEKKHELVLLRLRYLKKELQFTEETHESASEEFLEAYKKKVASLPEAQKDKIRNALEKENKKRTRREQAKKVIKKEKKKEEGQADKEKSAKRLFKEVAKASHPDVMNAASEKEREKKEVLFKKAQEAVSENRYFDLIEVAEKLDIDIPPPSPEGLNLLKESVSKINAQIKSLKSTFAWVWYHSENRKLQVMSDYISRIIRGNIRT